MVPTQSHVQAGFLGSFSCILKILIRWTALSARLAWFLPSSAALANVVVKTRLAHFLVGGVGVGVGMGHCSVMVIQQQGS